MQHFSMETGESITVKTEVREHEDEIKDTPDLVDPLSLQETESEFYCMTCSEIFAHKLSRDIHEMLHDPNCYCFICKTNYKPQNFPDHVRKMHMNLICNICNKAFRCKKSFKIHHNSHTKETIFECDQCDKSFMQRSSLRTHQYSAHQGHKLKCKICSGTFITPSSLKRHLKNMHSKDQILYCRICLEEFSDKKARNDHEQEHTKSKVCNECGKKYEKIYLLTKHLVTTHFRTEKCEYCQKLFHRLKLQAHITAVHSPKKCSVCNAIFYTGRSFMQHCRSHNNKMSAEIACDMISTKITCKICRKKFKESFIEKHWQQHKQNEIKKCSICYKYFVNMEKHDASVHKNGKYYVCKYCPRKFLTKCSLREHSIKGHRKRNGKFKCKICFKIFFNRHYLQRHYINHNTYRPYQCDVCLMQFKRPINLRRHKVTHAEKKFQCETCFRKFRFEWTLLGHKCPGDKVTCVVCSIKFASEHNLKYHQVAMHSPRTGDNIKKGFNILEQHFHLNSISNVNIIKTSCKKKYQCTKCKIVFVLLENFKRHLCMQFVRKNYCAMCQRMFQTKQDWIQHVKLKHGNLDVHCKFCGLICSSTNSLKLHLRLHMKKSMELREATVNYAFEDKTELNGKFTDTNGADEIENLQNAGIPKIVNIQEVVEESSIKMENEIVFKSEEFISE